MNRPWQIWLSFAAALGLVLGAVGWLSFRALKSDEAEAAASRQAALDEKASLALWRMDSYMTPLVAQESARPYFMYSSFYSNERLMGRGGKGKGDVEVSVPSPLLSQSTPNVLLHFQCDPQQQLTSPEVPEGKALQEAADYLPEDQIRQNGKVLAEFHKTLDTPLLLEKLPPAEPATMMPAFPGIALANLTSNGSLPNGSQALANNSAQLAPTMNGSVQAGQQPQMDGNLAPNVPGGKEQAANPFVPSQTPNTSNTAQFLAQDQQGNRNQLELQARTKSFVQTNVASQNAGYNNFDKNNDRGQPNSDVQMSMMTPLWLGGDLVLARRVKIGNRDYVQGCLLDWPAIKRQLLGDVKEDLLPNADLQPAPEGGASTDVRRLASLPVMLIPGSLAIDDVSPTLSPIKQSLFIAWGAMGLAALAGAVLLRGVMSLSERRGAFVSAVTHELRTPLTTFRMYAEMLSEGMVRDEGDRRHYLETLRLEADRLTHLVANVLAYARLERGGPGGRIETVSVERLLEVATQRLSDRAGQAQLELSIEPGDGVLQRDVRADPAAVEQILFNLVDNACKYASTGSDRTLHLSTTTENGRVWIRLRDHGDGVIPGEERRLFQPFCKSARDAAHSAPGVGLGLALSQRLARDMRGDLRYEPTANGACFALSLPVAE